MPPTITTKGQRWGTHVPHGTRGGGAATRARTRSGSECRPPIGRIPCAPPRIGRHMGRGGMRSRPDQVSGTPTSPSAASTEPPRLYPSPRRTPTSLSRASPVVKGSSPRSQIPAPPPPSGRGTMRRAAGQRLYASRCPRYVQSTVKSSRCTTTFSPASSVMCAVSRTIRSLPAPGPTSRYLFTYVSVE